MLFEALAQFSELTAFTDREGSFLWRWVLPYHKRPSLSDAIGPGEFGWWRRSALALLFRVEALIAPRGRGHFLERVARLITARSVRYLDKTIDNCFRLDLLREMFPDASFIYLVREPKANIASMIEGWSHYSRFGKPALTPLVRAAAGPLNHWSYAAPPGWHRRLQQDLPSLCAWSWQQHVEAILRFHARTGVGHIVRYEDLVAAPEQVVSALADALGLTITDAIRAYLTTPPPSRTTVSAAAPAKWKEQGGSEFAAAVDAVAPTVERLGY